MRRLLSLLPMLFMASGAAFADGISLDFQHAEIIRLAKPAKSVIIGDPYVADLTLQDPKTIVLFGKQPGITNLVVFDEDSNMLLNWPVMVRDATANRVSVITPGEKRVYEAVWMCSDQNRCIRIPGSSDIDPFKYNATSASDTTTGSKGSDNAGKTGDSGSGDNNGGTTGGGTSGGSNDQPPAN